MFEHKPGWLTLATLGLRAAVDDRLSRVPSSVGRLEAERFDPLQWKPVSQSGLRQHAARRCVLGRAHRVEVLDEAIRVVEKARYSDPAATDFMTKTIIARRNKVVATWINQVCRLSMRRWRQTALTFTNAAVDAKAATAPERMSFGGSGSITRPTSERLSASR